MVTPARFERATFPLGGGRSIQLSYGAKGVRIPDAVGRQKTRPANSGALMPKAMTDRRNPECAYTVGAMGVDAILCIKSRHSNRKERRVNKVAPASHVYGAYGEIAIAAQVARTAYAGGSVESGTRCYLLGDRLFSPALRRFLNPDPVSPFDDGGLNRYAYCGGDPVNRIDPGGNAWSNWLIAGQGPTRIGLGAAGNAGALGAAAGGTALARQAAAVVTPTTVTITAAAVLDAAVVTSEARSVASAAGDKNAGGMFGWMAMGSGTPSIGSSLSPKARARSAGFLGHRWDAMDTDAPRYNIDVVPSDQIPAWKFRYSTRKGALTLNTRWVRRTDPLDARVSHWAPDTTISGRKIAHPLKRIGRMPIADGNDSVYLYSGVHGSRYGDNWENGSRRLGEYAFYWRDRRSRRRLAAHLPGRNLSVENIAGVSTDEMIEKMSRPGVHVHAYCFGAVDSLMLAVLGANPVPVYLRR